MIRVDLCFSRDSENMCYRNQSGRSFPRPKVQRGIVRKFFIIVVFIIAVGAFQAPVWASCFRECGKVQSACAKEMAHRHKLICIGTGYGRIDGQPLDEKLGKLSLTFQIDYLLTIDQIRAILLDCANDLIARTNANKRLASELSYYPVTARNVEITLLIHGPDGESGLPPHIKWVFLNEGVIEYASNDPNQNGFGWITQRREDYATALELVGADVETAANTRRLLAPPAHIAELKARAYEVLDRCSEKIASQYQLVIHTPDHRLRVGDDKLVTMKAAFHIIGARPKKELRRIAVEANLQLQEAINSDMALRPYLKAWPASIQVPHIEIAILEPTGRHVASPNVSVVTADGRYVAFSESRRGGIEYEPWDVALTMMRSANSASHGP